MEPNFFSLWLYADPFGDKLIGYGRRGNSEANLQALGEWKTLPLLFGFSATPTFTLVPASIFREEDADTYLRFNTAWEGQDDLDWDPLPSMDMVVVYGGFHAHLAHIHKQWPGTKFSHAASHVIPLLMRSKWIKSPHFCAIYGTAPHYMVFIFSAGILLLANGVDAAHHSDLVYYLLFAFKQLDLAKNIDGLLLGECAEDADLQKSLEAYLRVKHRYTASDFGLHTGNDTPFPGKLVAGYTGLSCV